MASYKTPFDICRSTGTRSVESIGDILNSGAMKGCRPEVLVRISSRRAAPNLLFDPKSGKLEFRRTAIVKDKVLLRWTRLTVSVQMVLGASQHQGANIALDVAQRRRFNVAMTSHFFLSVGSSRPPSRSVCHSRRFPSPSSSKISSNSNPSSTATVKKGASFRRPV